MKKNLFLYLFIFAILINIFTYMYFTSKAKFDESQIKACEKREKESKAKEEAVVKTLEDANYFALETNDNAMEYFAGQDIKAIVAKVNEGMDKMNQNKNGNPLVDYPPMGGAPFRTNKVKILNHRWIIADFSNGSAWGEILVKYFVDSNGNVTFEPMQTVLYSDTVN